MSNSPSQETRSAQTAEQRRRKRKERAARSRTPEPKDIVSGAGQPLDPGVRRELEERLGHDLSRVRLHTGRDAGQLTELLGADAVAVGQDVFFGEGTYRPGTDEGLRLLAHELLHTVQNPQGLGTLRAGRELGAVSLPQQTVEREAESAAQNLVRQPEAPTEVTEGQATPGWLRYATVDADRRRTEQLDPATLVDRLANGILRSLRGDPEDRSGRARLQLARMAPQVQDIVLDRLEIRLPAPALDRLLEAVEETEEAGPLPLEPAAAPLAVPGAAEEIEEERESVAERTEQDEVSDKEQNREEDGSKEPDKSKEPGEPNGSGEQTDAQRRAEQGARQQERAQVRQEARDASGRETQQGAAEAGRDMAEAEGEQQEDTGGEERGEGEETVQEEAPPEPEKQAAEGEPQQPAAQQPVVPSPVDRSGTEPGERHRTEAAARPTRSLGDPGNAEDTDDEPLGLEADFAEETADETPEMDEDSGVQVPDPDLAGATAASRNASIAEARRKGSAPRPSLSDPASEAAPDTEQEQPGPSPAEESESSSEDDTEAAAVRDLLAGASAEQDAVTDGMEGSEAAPTLTAAPGGSPETRLAQNLTEDAEVQRRDAEARAADAAGTGAAPEAGETAAAGQLDKAGEDARAQGAASGTGSAAGASKQAEPEPGAKTAGTQKGTERQEVTGAAGQVGQGADRAVDKGADTSKDTGSGTGTAADRAEDGPGEGLTESPSGGDVTEGSGPATTPGPRTGPDKVSAPGPADAPKLAPGNGPPPVSGGAEARTNAPKTAESPAAEGSRPTGAKRQAARQAAKAVSRNAGGSGRTASAPTPVRTGGRGGSRTAPAGGSRAKKAAPAPDVSHATPESGLATAAGLKPHQMLETLKGVDGAVGSSVAKERTALRKAPPRTQRPSGSPRTVPGGPQAAAPGTYTNAKVARTEAAAGRTPEITGEQRPEGEVPGANVPEPSWWDIAVTIGAQLFGKLLKEILPLDDLIDSILGLPTKDEGLQKAKVGDAPRLPLENDSDPQRTDEQSDRLDERKNELHRAGREDAARPMGEDQIYPDVPKETLKGKVPGAKGAAKSGGPRSVSGGVPIESASAVAEHDRGPQIQAGFAESRQKMGQERQAKDQKAADDRKDYDENLRREVSASSKKQADARDKGRTDIADSRDRWRKEQDDKVGEIDDKKGKKYDQVRKDIKQKEEDTDKDVDKRTEDDNKKIETEQTNAERDAEKKQDEGKDDADNWLEGAIEKLKEFFEGIKNAIKSIFEKARQAVTDLIDKFKQQVFKLIDDARNWVIDQINTFADALIALGDELLADYPEMRDKWRGAIDGARDWAVQKVNEFADALKEVAGRLLDGLCGALLAGLDLLETGLLAAVDIAETVTVGALEFGAAVVQGLGEWAAIFNDIVSDPGDWIGKAGAAAETGAKEHLFAQVKTAVKAWFDQKVQEIVGISAEDFQALIDGGVTVDQMAQMAWDEAVPQLPVIIGVLVVEKVVAKLIPGAGWVMAIIDALQTAWGALSEILAAFGLFMDFLKSVKSGNGALPFAKAVAAGVVALLELVYTFLIEGVGRFMGKVADRLGDMLKKIRTKKDKPGPGQPDAPNKPKDDDKPKQDDAKDPKDKDSAPAAPRKPSSDKTSRPPSRPRPGKRSSPEKKSRPSHTTRPKKRRDDDERREEGREVNAARRRMRDADRDRDDRTGTPARRGAARDTLRPDRGRPGADRRNDRDRDPESRPGDRRSDPRRPDGRRRDERPRDDRRRDDKRRDGDRDRRSEGSRRRGRARQTVKSAVSRARRAVNRLYGKARRTLGRRLDDRLRRLRDQWRRRDERDRDRTPDRRPNRRRDDERQRENNGITDFDLPQVRFRTKDGEAHTLLFDGKGRAADLAVRSVQQAMTAYFGDWDNEIEELKRQGKTDLANAMTDVLAAARRQYQKVETRQRSLPKPRNRYGISRGTPGDVAFQRRIERLRDEMESLAELLEQRNSGDKEPPLPDTVLPPFLDGPVAFNFKARFIQKTTPAGTEAEDRRSAQPVGWKELDQLPGGRIERGRFWVRMHMLPAKLGGHASTSNLVPALGAINTRAMVRIEHPAQAALGHAVEHGTIPPTPETMIWYQVSINYRGQYPGFPSRVGVRWGGYRPSGNQWREQGATRTWAENFPAPNITAGFEIKKAKAAMIRMVTRVSDDRATEIARLLKAAPSKYTSVDDLIADLAAGGAGLAGPASQQLRKDLAKLRAAHNKIRF
ncbi:DUF4157 domain-containing protein [Streptomyces sp. TRM68416]|uniref:eCIS core domain-containing protein n=1 Tax=Streptomyces sp. TRM68416 TaxID=2758412 RepID=UPI001661E311|nr:DUF4157 domain-containing protein [Streptomyces sp. TRM68416]MBD0840630.1 DUF4157 domain-containing protein [Streptomyces sp. TRM68416]